MRPIIAAVVLGALCGAPTRAGAAAWTQEPMHFYLQLSLSFVDADARYNSAGDRAPIAVRKFSFRGSRDVSVSNFQQLLAELYGELGLLDRLTLFADLPVQWQRQQNPGGDIDYYASGVGDLLVGARVGLLKDPFAFALEVRLGVPTGDPRAVIPTGSGDLRTELRAVGSKAWSFFYVDGEVGLQLRGSATVNDPTSPTGTAIVKYSPEMVLHGEVGFTLFRLRDVLRLSAGALVDYRTSTARADANDAFFTLIPDSSELTLVGANLQLLCYRWIGILFRFADAVEGRRLPAYRNFGGGIFASW